MKNLVLLLLLAICSAVALQYCTSSQAKPVSVKTYLSHKVLVSCMPGAPGYDEWKEDPTGIPAFPTITVSAFVSGATKVSAY